MQPWIVAVEYGSGMQLVDAAGDLLYSEKTECCNRDSDSHNRILLYELKFSKK